MALFKKKTASDESYYMASQWTLMWRKLQKHKLAKFSLVILAVLLLLNSYPLMPSHSSSSLKES